MKSAILAAVAAAAAASFSVPVLAQDAPPPPHRPSARNGLNEQLDQLSARIDRRLARGQLSQKEADQAHREINDIQAEASDDRLQNGGQLKEADRFGLQARISQLKEKVDGERVKGAGTSPR